MALCSLESLFKKLTNYYSTISVTFEVLMLLLLKTFKNNKFIWQSVYFLHIGQQISYKKNYKVKNAFIAFLDPQKIGLKIVFILLS